MLATLVSLSWMKGTSGSGPGLFSARRGGAGARVSTTCFSGGRSYRCPRDQDLCIFIHCWITNLPPARQDLHLKNDTDLAGRDSSCQCGALSVPFQSPEGQKDPLRVSGQLLLDSSPSKTLFFGRACCWFWEAL